MLGKITAYVALCRLYKKSHNLMALEGNSCIVDSTDKKMQVYVATYLLEKYYYSNSILYGDFFLFIFLHNLSQPRF